MVLELESRKLELIGELAGLGGMLRGSIVVSTKKCGNKGCECERKNIRIHPFQMLTTTTGVGKTKGVYIRKAEMESFRDGLAQYKRVKEIIEELSEINIRLIKARSREG